MYYVALLIGPNDLLGIPGDLFNKIELDAIAHVAAACKKNNKAFGLHAGPKLLEMFINDLNIVMMYTDIDLLNSGFKNMKQTFDDLSK